MGDGGGDGSVGNSDARSEDGSSGGWSVAVAQAVADAAFLLLLLSGLRGLDSLLGRLLTGTGHQHAHCHKAENELQRVKTKLVKVLLWFARWVMSFGWIM